MEHREGGEQGAHGHVEASLLPTPHGETRKCEVQSEFLATA